MNNKTHTPVTDPSELASIEQKLGMLMDEDGHLRRGWWRDDQWIVVPVWGIYQDSTEVARRVAAVAREFGASWFLSALPPGSRNPTMDGRPLPTCYRAPVSDRGLGDVSWEWLPELKHVVTTEDFRFAIVNPIEVWYLVAGPRLLVERLLGGTLEEAWIRFGANEAPFDEFDLHSIRAQLDRYRDFFGTAVNKTIGGEALDAP